MHFFWNFYHVPVDSRHFLNGGFHSQIFLVSQFSATISEIIIVFLFTVGKFCQTLSLMNLWLKLTPLTKSITREITHNFPKLDSKRWGSFPRITAIYWMTVCVHITTLKHRPSARQAKMHFNLIVKSWLTLC